MLADRVWTAVELYTAGKVQKLLISSDNRFIESISQKPYGSTLASAVCLTETVCSITPRCFIRRVASSAGWRTYDTCYRAEYIFRVEEVILVTQWFHLDRALYTAINWASTPWAWQPTSRTILWPVSGGCANWRQ